MSRLELNTDWHKRDGILQQYSGNGFAAKYDIYHYKGLPVEVLKQLRDEKFLDLEEHQNAAPYISEFIEFMEAWPGLYTVNGYAVSFEREDYRVSIEGIKATRKLTREEMKQFCLFAHGADEFDPEGDAWWD